MKSSMKRFFCIAIAAAIVIVMAAACGSKKEDSAEQEETKAEVSEEQTEEPEAQEEESEEEETDVKEEQEENAEMTEEQKAAQDEKEELLRALKERGEEPNMDYVYDPVDMLHASEEQLQELYDAVKTAVTEEYLVKYNISPSEFEWPENQGGEGTPKPESYLENKILEKAKTSWETDEEVDGDPAAYNIDQQTADLMDCVYRPIVNWARSNNCDKLAVGMTSWSIIIAQHVTFD